jgi:hypothetical protein
MENCVRLDMASARVRLGAGRAYDRLPCGPGLPPRQQLSFRPSLVAGQVALLLSLRTIDAHLRGIYTKLGITSRSQLRDTDLANAEGIDPR